MRKSFFSLIGLFLMTFVFTGCGESVKESQAQKEAAEKARQDSINAAIAQAKTDSIEKARQDSLEQAVKVENTIIFITDFYKKSLDNRFNFNVEEKAVKENCTNKFYKEWKEITSPEPPDPESGLMSYPCEYDPIICEQSCMRSPQIEEWKNLQVESIGGDDYEVCFRLKWGEVFGNSVADSKKILRIKVTEENGMTKISDIKDMNPDG